jgi:hypothetical protein
MIYYIEEKPQSLFVDLIYKNATCSMLNSLVNYGKNKKNIEGNTSIHDLLPTDIIKINENNIFFDSIKDLEDIFKVTCFRDPHARVISAFLDKILNNRSTNVIADFFVLHGKDLEKFKNDPIKYFDIFVDFIYNSDKNYLDHHIKPQNMIIKFNPEQYNKVLNFSTIEKDWEEVIKIFPKLPNLPANKVNSNKYPELKEILSTRNIKKIKEIYETDYAMLKLI